MNRLQLLTVFFLVMVALGTATSTASAAEPEGPFFQVNVEPKQHCFKAVGKGNYSSLTECEKNENFTKLEIENGFTQVCVERSLGVFSTEEKCLHKTGLGFFSPGWRRSLLYTPLASNQTRLLLASAKESFTLESKGAGIVIKCTGLKLPEAAQMQIQGVAAGNGGISKEAVEFTGCTQAGNGEACEVEGGKLKTSPLLNLLGYSTSTRTGSVLVLFEPETGKTVGKLHFLGAGCVFTETNIEGTFVGSARVNGTPILIGAEPDPTLHGEVRFPHTQLIFVERGGALKHVKAGLTAFGLATTLTGTELLQVDEGGVPVKWAIYT